MAGETGTAATLRAEIEQAVSEAVSLAGVNLEAAKDELAANTVTAIESVRLLSEEAVAGLRKSVNGNKATTVSALKAASDANAKARAVISDDVKAVAALVDAVLECNAERKLYNASDEKCIDVLPPPPPLCGLEEDTPCDDCQQTMDEGQSSGTLLTHTRARYCVCVCVCACVWVCLCVCVCVSSKRIRITLFHAFKISVFSSFFF